MAKCPKCEKEINQLDATWIEKIESYVQYSGNGLDWGETELLEMHELIFRCPECKKVVAESDGEALEILAKSEVKVW
jgi:phage FluMu protein Com